MKRKKKFLMLFSFLLVGGVNGYAQDKVPGIIVELANGQKVEYRLADNPKFVFDGQTITLTADGVQVEYTPSELAKVMTGDVEGATGIVETEKQSGDIKVEDGFVRLKGFSAGEAVHVYSVSGTQMASYQISSDGSLVIPVSALPSGISIIKTNQQTIKITRK